MSKYIIEIEEKPLCVFDKDTQTYFPRLWRVKGFNSLVFDEEGLSRLEELNSDYINEHYGQLQDDAYQRGLNDAWEAAKKLFSSMADSDIDKAFPIEWNNGGFNALMNLQPQEAIEKLKAYEERQKADDEIEVGDEIRPSYSDIAGVVTLIDDDTIYVLWRDGSSTSMIKLKEVRKTGRHFDIASILEDMRND